ncbi:MAG: hypothetical protein J0M24_20215 [Verrucomicrobia bacterium]|nr:hypothetical protein [Verrucomicrobiota bacterium]
MSPNNLLSMEFVATECGFEAGVGGASNAAGTADYHYVLFGRQTDAQQPEFSGVYFEFDGQMHGGVDRVGAITVTDDRVSFELRHGHRIVVRSGLSESQWAGFVKGIRDTFGDDILRKE